MNKEQVRSKILDIAIVPVVRASSAAEARMAAEALTAGGISCLEITMTVPGAIDVIRELTASMSKDVLVGAGTVLDAATAQKCVDAGAQFLVSPGFDAQTVAWAVEHKILIAAGALTPTEVFTAWKAGSDFVKVFPCANVGGAKYIKALRGPLPQVPLIPTGGVNLETAADFLKAGSAALGVGGELVLADALKAKQPERITELARKFVAVVREARNAAAVAR
ncbi:MAG: bifunctional 4-hydroxy-2-oxoglutarate aldolase/2-dehydro-3-deoxy-phosphogluconate aldolase [Terriglobales bacterium]